ncbi:Uroporphyrinogen-III synthase [invertebrate metagenome]|uniref:Uroporphyrinogen-III synthase n=1 Tax=invertebrate metagenome TaxID=1711999 RepID=A0A484H724_9ZZZZ
MAPRVLVTRPVEDAAALTDRLLARGCEVVHEPMLSIRFLGRTIDIADVQAVLITSANGARALAAATPARAVPVFAVGDASSRTCRAFGFYRVTTASGDVADLARLVTAHLRPENGALLHAASHVTAGDLSGRLRQAGFSVRKVCLYEADTATALTTARLIADGAIDAALFYSPRTAATFATLVNQAGVSQGLTASRAYCLSEAVRYNISGLPWQLLRVATVPDQESLLAAFDRDQTSPSDNFGCLTTQGEKDMTTRQTPEESKGNLDSNSIQATTGSKTSLASPQEQSRAANRAFLGQAADSRHCGGSQETCNRDDSQENPSDGRAAASVPTVTPLAANTETVLVKPRRRTAMIGTVLLIATLFILTMILFLREYVPEPYRAYLPTLPILTSAEHETFGIEMQRAMTSLRRDLADITSQLNEQRRSHEILEERLMFLEKPVAVGRDGSFQLPESTLQRLAALESAVSELTSTEQREALIHQITTFESRINSISAQLDAVYRGSIGDTTAVDKRLTAFESRINSISAQLHTVAHESIDDPTAVDNRLTALEEAVRRTTRQDATAAPAWLLAVTQLREAVHRGSPFTTELHAARAFAEDVAIVDAAVAGFIAYAVTGLPTRSAIETRFDSLNSAIARAAMSPEGDSWLAHALQRLLGAITIRRTDGTATGNKTLAVMARAGTALHAGDLIEAVRIMDSLQGLPARVAESWIAFARARATADEALARLTAHALGRTAASYVKE